MKSCLSSKSQMPKSGKAIQAKVKRNEKIVFYFCFFYMNTLSSPASLLGLIYPLSVPLNFLLKLESLEDKKILSGETLIAASEEGTADSLGTSIHTSNPGTEP